ncbi:MAG: helix-turn-helix transcriptional regulator [Dehalococcoidia bacterium]
MDEWREAIRRARDGMGWSRLQAAKATGIGKATIEAWETGGRHPKRENLLRYCERLEMPLAERRPVLADAGFEPEPNDPAGELRRRRRIGLRPYADEMEAYPWSFLLLDDYNDILAWNSVAEAVAELNFAEHFETLGERNVVWLAATAHFRKHLLNWMDLIGRQVSFWKMAHLSRPPDSETGEAGQGAAPLLQMMMELGTRFPEAFGDLLTLYQTVPVWREGARNSHPVKWRVADGTVLRFETVFRAWSDFDSLYAFDWHPANAETWRWVEKTMGTREAHSREHWEPDLPVRWNEALRAFRERVKLSQAEFGARVGLSANAVYSLEKGRRRPRRDTVMTIVRTLQMDGPTMNFILEDLGMSPEPSWIARWMSGLDVAYHPNASLNYLSAAELERDAERLPWPLFVFDADCRLIGGNTAARRFDPFPLPPFHETEGGPHLLELVTSEAFRMHVENWEEVVLTLVPAPLKPFLNPTVTGGPGRAFEQAVTAVRRTPNGTAAIRDLIAAWEKRGARRADARVVFRLRWRHDDGSLLVFDGLVAGWNALDPYWVIDLHPGDAATFEWFERQWGEASPGAAPWWFAGPGTGER